MGYIKTTGIVIKEVNTGEADKMLTILSKSHGRISVFAKSARRPKSSLVAGSQFLCYSDFVLFKGKDAYSVNSCEVVESFYEVRNDMVKLTYAAHFMELVSDIVQEEQPSNRVLQLLLNTLYMLAKTERSPELLCRIFEMRLLAIIGYAPYDAACIKCGCNCDDTEYYFSFIKCGILCRNCYKEDTFAYRISIGTLKALQYIIHSKMKYLFGFNLSDQVLYELSRINRRYIRERLEKDYSRLDFLKEIL